MPTKLYRIKKRQRCQLIRMTTVEFHSGSRYKQSSRIPMPRPLFPTLESVGGIYSSQHLKAPPELQLIAIKAERTHRICQDVTIMTYWYTTKVCNTFNTGPGRIKLQTLPRTPNFNVGGVCTARFEGNSADKSLQHRYQKRANIENGDAGGRTAGIK